MSPKGQWIDESWFELTMEDQHSSNEELAFSPRYSPLAQPKQVVSEARAVKVASSQDFQVLTPFPVKLFHTLEDAPRKGFADVISWHSNGKSFRIHDRNRFERFILPEYFREQIKYRSFQRQLNVYGFSRETHGDDAGYYSNPWIQRDRPDLCRLCKVRRKRKTSDGGKIASSSETTSPSPTPCEGISSRKAESHEQLQRKTDSLLDEKNEDELREAFGRKFYIVNHH